MCENILKKERPSTNQIPWIEKNRENLKNSLNYRFSAIYQSKQEQNVVQYRLKFLQQLKNHTYKFHFIHK